MELNRYNASHSVKVHFNHIPYRKQIMSVGDSGLQEGAVPHFPRKC